MKSYELTTLFIFKLHWEHFVVGVGCNNKFIFSVSKILSNKISFFRNKNNFFEKANFAVIFLKVYQNFYMHKGANIHQSQFAIIT